jgi:hypothetical protein
MKTVLKIRIRETRIVTLPVTVDTAKMRNKEEIRALVEKAKDALQLSNRTFLATDEGQPLMDAQGNRVGTLGMITEDDRTREVLQD